MMARPIAITLAQAIDKQLANAMGADRCDSDRASHRHIFDRRRMLP